MNIVLQASTIEREYNVSTLTAVQYVRRPQRYCRPNYEYDITTRMDGSLSPFPIKQICTLWSYGWVKGGGVKLVVAGGIF